VSTTASTRSAAVAVVAIPSAEVDAVDALGMTPLQYCALFDRADLARVLLRHGASIEARTTGDARVVDGVTETEQPDARSTKPSAVPAGARVVDPLARGAAPAPAAGLTALQVALAAGHHSIASLLRPGEGRELEFLFRGAADGDAGLVRFLVQHEGINVDTRAVDPGPLARSGGPEITLLHVAARYGRRACVEVLLELGAAVNAICDDRAPLHEAASLAEPDIARMLLAHGSSPSLRDGTGATPLHVAASSAPAEAVTTTLLSLLPDADPVDRMGRTPLFAAVQHRCWGNVRLLVAAGADILAADVAGNTPLALSLTRTRRANYLDLAPSRELVDSISMCFFLQVFFFFFF
jgi:ankyrin repeat protein